MRELCEVCTVEEIDSFIDEICRHLPPGLLERAKSVEVTEGGEPQMRSSTRNA